MWTCSCVEFVFENIKQARKALLWQSKEHFGTEIKNIYRKIRKHVSNRKVGQMYSDEWW